MSAGKPVAFSSADKAKLKQVRGVCLDIDDTLSTHGKLTAQAFSALWKLKESGLAVVPVTGRPAGWCDHLARFWPVDAVIGENGAFSTFMQDGKLKKVLTPGADLQAKARLKALGDAIRKRFPQAQWASDQPYREFDLAIDFCEDVAPWNDADITRLVELCQAEGAHAKVSSIHVNAWFGDYDKQAGLRHWLSLGAPGFKPSAVNAPAPKWNEWLFIGDSPNDEPLFQAFELSVGVANLSRFLPKLKHPPTWITAGESGAGFTEMVEGLLSARSLA